MRPGGGSKGGKGGGKGKGKGGRGPKPADEAVFYDPPPGTLLEGAFRVERLLGTGTFSHVFEVTDVAENRAYACKVMAPLQQYLQYTSDGRKEGELLARLTAEDADGQAGVMRLKTFFPTRDPAGGEWYCLVMEKMDCSVHDFLQSNGGQGLEIRTIQSMARQLLTTVAFLHDRRLTHTDIKHKNVMLLSAAHTTIPDPARRPLQVRSRPISGHAVAFKQLIDPTVKIIDYGNVTHADEPHAQPIHTKQFRCPEVMLECGRWDEQSDLWCVACVLAYLYTGALLFNTHDTNLHLALMEKVLGPIPDALLRTSRRYRNLSGPPVERFLRQNNSPWELTAARPLADLILPAHAPFLRLLAALFAFDPRQRPTAREALQHPFFSTVFAPEV